jgi:chitinase
MTPTSGTSPLQVTFDASASSGVASSLVGYAWVFGDGTTGSGRTITHTYNSPGTYSILLTVTDADGFTNTATHVVPVSASQNVPPVAEKFQIQQPNVLHSAIMTISTLSGYVPLTVFFDASGSSDSDGTIVSYFWDFGDGIPFGGRQVSHTFWHSSTYPVRLTVTDDRGGQGVATQTIQVTTMSSHYRDRYKIEAPEPIIY